MTKTGTTEILNSDTPWDLSEDRILWLQFLSTRTGQRLFSKALDSQPALLAKGDVNEMLVRSGEVRGWSACISTLAALSLPEPRIQVNEQADNYPDLTDDEAWKDKSTVTPT